MIPIHFEPYPFKIQKKEKGNYIFDIIRKKYVFLSPEEWVRQNFIHYLINTEKYPKGLISVEKEIKINNLRKRYDIVVFDKLRTPWMLIECKEPEVSITDKTLQQLLRYHQVLQCPFWVLTNGLQTYCGEVKKAQVNWLNKLPPYDFKIDTAL